MATVQNWNFAGRPLEHGLIGPRVIIRVIKFLIPWRICVFGFGEVGSGPGWSPGKMPEQVDRPDHSGGKLMDGLNMKSELSRIKREQNATLMHGINTNLSGVRWVSSCWQTVVTREIYYVYRPRPQIVGHRLFMSYLEICTRYVAIFRASGAGKHVIFYIITSKHYKRNKS
jgi:hypothetical protein